MSTQAIVIAWTDEDFRVLPGARTDLGERPKIETFKIAKAAIWLNKGDEDDLASAKIYAAEQGYLVFTYPVDTPNPLELAKKDVMR